MDTRLKRFICEFAFYYDKYYQCCLDKSDSSNKKERAKKENKEFRIFRDAEKKEDGEFCSNDSMFTGIFHAAIFKIAAKHDYTIKFESGGNRSGASDADIYEKNAKKPFVTIEYENDWHIEKENHNLRKLNVEPHPGLLVGWAKAICQEPKADYSVNNENDLINVAEKVCNYKGKDDDEKVKIKNEVYFLIFSAGYVNDPKYNKRYPFHINCFKLQNTRGKSVEKQYWIRCPNCV